MAPPVILVADDHPLFRAAVLHALREALPQASVAEAASAPALGEALLAHPQADLVLLDLTMPRMTGVEVVRWLRDRPDVAPELRIVVISAWAGENRAVLQELGITTVMQKPLRIQQLTDLIAETLRDLES